MREPESSIYWLTVKSLVRLRRRLTLIMQWLKLRIAGRVECDEDVLLIPSAYDAALPTVKMHRETPSANFSLPGPAVVHVSPGLRPYESSYARPQATKARWCGPRYVPSTQAPT